MEDSSPKPKFVLCDGAAITSAGSLSLPDDYMVEFENASAVATVNHLIATNAQFKFTVAASAPHARSSASLAISPPLRG